MPASITRGKTFGATESVTNTKLHQLIENGSISGIDASNFASGVNIVTRSTSAPSNTDGLWVDTNQSPPVVKKYTGTEWQPAGPYALLTNKSGGSVAAGDVVVADTTTDGSFKTSTTTGDGTVIGVVQETIANNADGVVALPGARVTNINCNGAVTRGQFLKHHSVAKQAVATSTGDVGVFAIALAALGSSGALTEALLIGTNVITIQGASLAEVKTGTEASKYVAPSTLVGHEGVIKGWINFTANGTVGPAMQGVNDSFNVGAMTDNGACDWTIGWDTDFGSANHCDVGTSDGNIIVFIRALAAGSTRIGTLQYNGSAVEPSVLCLMAIGDR